jgi:hypothetical protein
VQIVKIVFIALSSKLALLLVSVADDGSTRSPRDCDQSVCVAALACFDANILSAGLNERGSASTAAARSKSISAVATIITVGVAATARAAAAVITPTATTARTPGQTVDVRYRTNAARVIRARPADR